jgi:hypothetical protein
MLRYLRRHAGIIASTSPGKESIPEMWQLSGVDVGFQSGGGCAGYRLLTVIDHPGAHGNRRLIDAM